MTIKLNQLSIRIALNCLDGEKKKYRKMKKIGFLI